MGLRALSAGLVALSLSACASLPTQLSGGFTTDGRTLLDANGEPFVMRGINQAHAWLPETSAEAIPAIADTGANIVRIALSNGARWDKTPPAEVAALLDLAAAHDMIAMVEVHDVTGYGQHERSVHIAQTLPYWLELLPVLEGREATVIVNPGNEPTGNTVSDEAYVEMMVGTIKALRAGGFTHTLVVDGHNWGQDHSGTMRDNAERLLAADPLRNIVFSVHMYQVYAEPETVEAYVTSFASRDLPLIVGEFGMDHQGEPVAEEAIFSALAREQYGYIGWSWSGNGGGVEDLDIVLDFDPSRLSPWGERLIHGENGIAASAKPASVFDGPEETWADRFYQWRTKRRLKALVGRRD